MAFTSYPLNQSIKSHRTSGVRRSVFVGILFTAGCMCLLGCDTPNNTHHSTSTDNAVIEERTDINGIQASDSATTEPLEISYEIMLEMVERTYRLFAEDNWPAELMLSKPGELPLSACGSSPAGYCQTDNTILLSHDFLQNAINSYEFAIPFILGHEVAHAIIINWHNPPKQLVLHELLADCISGGMIGEVFGKAFGKDGNEEMFTSLLEFTHSIGDPFYRDLDHHGFGAQRTMAFLIGYGDGVRAAYGDHVHETDCFYFFGDLP